MGFFFFSSVAAIVLAGRKTHFKSGYKWKKSLNQLFQLCGTWQQHFWKRSIRLPFSVRFQWAASPAFSQPVKLPRQQSEQSGRGIVKRNVQWWSGRKLQKESIQWVPSLHEKKNVYKSGRWPEPNNSLLKACLPRHNALQSQEELSNMATSAQNPFFHSATNPTQTCCQPHNLGAFSADLICMSLSLPWDWSSLS